MQKNETNQSNLAVKTATAVSNTEQNAILAQIAQKTERKLKLRWIFGNFYPTFIWYFYRLWYCAADYNCDAYIHCRRNFITHLCRLQKPRDAGQYFWYKERVRRDDTLKTVLSRLNIQNRDAIDFIRNDALANEVGSALKPGHAIQAKTDIDGHLINLEYQLEGDQFIAVKQTPTGYEASKLMHPLENRPILKSAKIKSSLFAATDDASIPDEIAIQVAELFESNIDFNSDLRRGDQLNVIYEGQYDQGELVSTGKIIAVEFTNDGKTYRAVGFKDAEGKMQYYTPEGMSLHKTFLRTPLEFTRISSSFSLGRFHPILQHIRAHEGTDFAALLAHKLRLLAMPWLILSGKKVVTAM